MLCGIAVVVPETFRSPAGVGGAAALAAALALWTWVHTGGRLQAALALAGDTVWVTVAVAAAGRLDAGFHLFYPLVAIAAGFTVGGRAAAGLSLFAGGALVSVGGWLGWLTGGPVPVLGQGVLILVLGLVADRMRGLVADRERALVHASKALERLRLDTDTIVEHLGSGVISVDSGGRVLHLNRTAAEMLGVGAEAARGRSLREVLAPAAAPLAGVLELGLLDGTPVQRREIDVRREDRVVPIGVGTTIFRGRDEEITGVAALFQDLTEIRREAEVQKRKERLAAVGELAAGIAHEIRNSILPVSGSVQLLAQELKLQGEQAKLFEVIERETDNIERFVSALLSYTRERRLMLVDLDLAELLRGSARDLDLGRPDPPRVVLELMPAPVTADGDQLRQVVRNLIANAADAAGPRGTVTLRSGTGVQGAWLEVADNGPGIPADKRDSVFRPFFTTKPGGTGLGLSIAARIVEDHGGVLELVGASRGTVFRVTVPGAVRAEAGDVSVPAAA